MNKEFFIKKFQSFVKELESYVSNENLEWKIKGFIDTDKTIFPISNDTKLVSKIIELHIFPRIYNFAEKTILL